MLIPLLSKLTGQNLIFPFYHAISDSQAPHIKHLYTIRNVKTFENDLDTLLKGFAPISINELEQFAKTGKTLPKRAFLLSFDDGLREFYEFAWPVLKRKGIPTVLFVNSGFVDNQTLFYRFKASLIVETILHKGANRGFETKVNELYHSVDKTAKELVLATGYGQKSKLDEVGKLLGLDFREYLSKQQPYLTVAELKQMQFEGLDIGAHSVDHPLFNVLDENAQYQQFIDSVNWVKQTFAPQHVAFSFPFTDDGLTNTFFAKIQASQQPEKLITFGTAGFKNEKIQGHFQRIPVESSRLSMAQILLRQYLYFMAKAPLGRNHIKRKSH